MSFSLGYQSFLGAVLSQVKVLERLAGLRESNFPTGQTSSLTEITHDKSTTPSTTKTSQPSCLSQIQCNQQHNHSLSQQSSFNIPKDSILASEKDKLLNSSIEEQATAESSKSLPNIGDNKNNNNNNNNTDTKISQTPTSNNKQNTKMDLNQSEIDTNYDSNDDSTACVIS